MPTGVYKRVKHWKNPKAKENGFQKGVIAWNKGKFIQTNTGRRILK